MPQIFYKDGSPVPDAKIGEAIASGDAHTKGGRVAVRDASGTIGTIDANELGKPGYQPLTDAEIEAERIHQERGTLGQQAITGLEGAARGATLGLSDVAATGVLGDDYRQAAKERAAENRHIAVGSEVLGAVAPALLTGGESAVAEGAAGAGREASLLGRAAEYIPSNVVGRAGRAVERGVAGIVGDSSSSMLGRMAQRAAAIGASGAVEGGLYGAGNAASEAALDGTPITAEKVLGGFGHGALFGGALGAGLGAAGGLGSSAFERIVGGSEGLKASAEKLANESALKAVGFQGSDFRRLNAIRGESAIDDVGSQLLDYTFESGPLKGQKLFTGAKKAEDFVDDLAFAKEAEGAKLGAMRAQVDAAGMAPDVNLYLERVQREVLDPLRKSLSPTIRGQADRVEAELSLLRERAAAVGAPPAPAFEVNVGAFDKSTMRAKSSEYVGSHSTEEVNRLGPPRIEIYEGERPAINDGRHRMQAAIDRGESSIDANVVHLDREGNVVSESMQPVSLVDTGAAKERGNWAHTAIRELPQSAPAEPLTFGELDKFRKQVRSIFQPPKRPGGGLPAPVPEHAEHLEAAERIIADELDKTVEKHMAAMGLDASEYEKAKRTYGAMADLEKVADKAAAQQLGNRRFSPSDYGVGVGGALGALMSGNVGGILYGVGASIAHKVIRERGNSVVAVMADSVAKMDGRITEAARSLAGLTAAPRRALLAGSSAPTGNFDRTANAVRSFASNPQVMQQALSKPVEGIADKHPQLAAQMQQTLVGDYQYLQQKLPQPLGRAGTSLTPNLEKQVVPKSEQKKFMSVVAALENPASVIEKVAAGELPRDQIEALKARRPEIYNQMRTEAIKAFSIAKAPRGILERTRVSLAFDFNGDASLDPVTLAAIQASNRTAPAPDDPPATDNPSKPGPKTTKLNPKAADDMSTPSQIALGS